MTNENLTMNHFAINYESTVNTETICILWYRLYNFWVSEKHYNARMYSSRGKIRLFFGTGYFTGRPQSSQGGQVPKSGERHKQRKLCPILLTPVLCEVLKYVIYFLFLNFWKKRFYCHKPGFLKIVFI